MGYSFARLSPRLKASSLHGLMGCIAVMVVVLIATLTTASALSPAPPALFLLHNQRPPWTKHHMHRATAALTWQARWPALQALALALGLHWVAHAPGWAALVCQQGASMRSGWQQAQLPASCVGLVVEAVGEWKLGGVFGCVMEGGRVGASAGMVAHAWLLRPPYLSPTSRNQPASKLVRSAPLLNTSHGCSLSPLQQCQCGSQLLLACVRGQAVLMGE